MEPSTKKDLRVLMLEDTPSDAELAERELRKAGIAYVMKRVETRDAFVRALEEFQPDVILSDYKLPDFDGMAALQLVQRGHPEVPVIMVTGALSDIEAVDLIHAGAKDYVLKDRLARLGPAVQRALSAEQNARARKAAEEALRASEAKYRALVESSSDWIWEVNEQAVYTYASPQVYELLGYTAGEIIGRTPFDLMPPDETVRMKAVFNAIAEERKPFRLLENVNLHKDGKTVFLESSGVPIVDVLGIFRGYRGIDRDITERKRAEEALHESRRILERIFDSTHFNVVYLDRDFNFIRVNRAYAQACGYPPEYFPGKNHFQLYPNAENEVIFRKVVQTGEPFTISAKPFEFPEHPEWGVSYWDWSLNPLKAPDGSVDALLFVLLDVTERKRAEEGLRVSELKNRLMFESSRDALMTLAPPSWKFTGANGATLQLFGASSVAEFTALGPWDVSPEQQPDGRSSNEKAQEMIATAMREGSHFFEWEHRRIGGRTFFADVLLTRMKVSEDVFLQASVRDITERKQAEIALAHANRALATLGAVNRQLVRATDEAELLHAICQAIVEQRSYRMAWVGYVQQDENKSVKIMASAGSDEGYLDTINVTWAETERGMGPSGRAIRSGTTQLCQDFASDPRNKPWFDAAQRRGYAASIALPLSNGKEVYGALTVYADEINAFSPNEVALLEEMAGDLAFGVSALHLRHERDFALEQNQQHLAQLQDSLEDTVRAIASMVEMRDPYTAGHQNRVADLAAAIAKQMGLSDEQVHAIHLAGVVHDLGKIQVPAEILSKPGRITDIEFSLIKIHPQAGFDILKGINFPWPIAQIVLQHHERLDGSGYPQGLKGDAILLEARILAVADVVEAMYSHRPYRPGLGLDAALAEITRQRGIYFDPQVVDACLTIFREQKYRFAV